MNDLLISNDPLPHFFKKKFEEADDTEPYEEGVKEVKPHAFLCHLKSEFQLNDFFFT